MSDGKQVWSSEQGVGALPGHIRGFGLMHVAMRRDAARLSAAAARGSSAGGWGPAAALADWFGRLRAVIDWHHHSEDEILWPFLRERLAGFDGGGILEQDHEALDRTMRRVADVLSARRIAELPEAAAGFENLIREHLGHEEPVVFPAIAGLPVDEYLRVERRIIQSAPGQVMTYLQPWMFDGADAASVRAVSATIPGPVRLIGRTVLERRYRRTLNPVL
ncbi:hemerythrin domain-containing protein [Kitasatospora sp. NPDC088779]|uniref:hemerythrin domain-containing protein n=1 Tax=unclassified Kitasatospora TaxID=2633591 RepID=UPI003418802B|nr:hemerythrin domain-containing protein [Kitasatospora sp. NBC_01300]